jgi:D-cysteine desulfhydrase family pyridoxal phosphate-dependent enzyme
MLKLSEDLGGVRLFIKRDDLTGLAFGGNKARKLDFILADVRAQKADTLVTWAGLQSNWCRQAIAACRVAGIRPVVILFKRPGLPSEHDGNLLLDEILGAEIKLIDLEPGKSFMALEDVREIVESVADRERCAGRKPYIAPIGGSLPEGSMVKPWGAIGYVKAMLELFDQAESQNLEIDYVVHATGSGSTQAGLVAGATLSEAATKIVGISVSENETTMKKYVRHILNCTLNELASTPPAKESDLIVFDNYIGAGYGMLNPETTHAIQQVAETEGILLDPVYTGKAMWGLIDLVRQQYFKPRSNIVFLHSGGTPALFPYRNSIREFIRKS